ncbi:Ca2+-transporting ATPase [Cladophialophora psammophila CBS 110553]|uniref:Calcium-transporting ATPase n=1 Tax=Cladophialophora psammophila CBS 110553 TaxID=1182543 RepID=W9WCG4_9EURO|nr:Ca2+-transporting ATPase [Cladophialophora psammophila CBS 110553]EXJ65792.1 Ca2+-transporting ATPase [Cladophialophora psammophila CBS 110553]
MAPAIILERKRGEEQAINKNNPFAFSPEQLSQLTNPKSHATLLELGGLAALEKGLKTDLRAGLSVDEEHPTGRISSQEAIQTGAILQTQKLPSGPEIPRERGDKKCHGFVDRKRVFGENVLPEKKPKSIWRLAWIAMHDKVLILLSVAAVVSLAVGLYQTFGPTHEEGARVEWVEGVAIIVAILIVVVVGALNDWQKERQFAKLNRKREDRLVKVIRSGRAMKIGIHDILVGDVVVLEPGDVLPVDGILIEGHNVSCDEASATGESDLIKKTPAEDVLALQAEKGDVKKLDPFMISGTKVSEGVGTFLVTAVGIHSGFGHTMVSLHEETDLTPLQFKLSALAGYIAKIGTGAGLLLFAVLLIEFLARLGTDDRSADEKAQHFMNILVTSITIIVVAVPEGLPLAVTLALAFATKRMTKDNNLVRHLQSCETMGNATVICSDKTGTLTQNVMTVVAGTIGAKALSFGDRDKVAKEPSSSSPAALHTRATDRNHLSHTATAAMLPGARATGLRDSENSAMSMLPPQLREILKESIALNTTAFEGIEKGAPTYIGSKTETALLDWAKRNFALGPLSVERSNYPMVELYPFDSRRKYMGVVVKTSSDKYRLFVKGAPEIVLEQCATVLSEPLDQLGHVPLEAAQRKTLMDVISTYASRSLRTMAIAYRDFDQWPPPTRASSNPDFPEQPQASDVFEQMTLLCVVGIQDPVRDGVPAAVKDCQRASVAVKMVTGDNIETARAIAKECGILKDDGMVMEGSQFRNLDKRELQSAAKSLCVLARSSPDDKRILVKALKELGEVVAVTGDGTNDAAALRAADVGFSMGITGTEVAKEASDIILMDDNFSSIVKALAWGRTVNDSVKKFLQFQITVNITAVILTFVSAVSNNDEKSVLTAVQLLWVNLIMDTFAALALATDPPNYTVLDRKPEPRYTPLINVTMWKMIMGQSLYQLTVTFILYFAGPDFLHYPTDEQRTLVFNVFVWMQIFKLVNSRRIDNKLNIFEGLHKNWLFMLMFTIMGVGQLVIVFVGGDAFVVTRLNGVQWAISLVLGFMSIPVGIVIRLLPDAVAGTIIRWAGELWRWLVPEAIRKRKSRSRGLLPVDEADKVFLNVQEGLAFLKRIRGGRIRLLGQGIKHPVDLMRRASVVSGSSIPPMHAAIAMPGIVAAGPGGLSPCRPRSSLSGSSESYPVSADSRSGRA